MGLIVIMTFSLTRMTQVMCLALLTLGAMSCTKQNDDPREELQAPATASLSSENTGETITLDLSATAETLNLPTSSESEGKALDYQIKSTKRIALKLDESKTEYKLLFILRAAGKLHCTYAIQTWKRSASNQLSLREVKLKLPLGLPYNMHNWEAMVFLVPDDFTEQKIKSQNFRFTYTPQKAGATGLISTAAGTTFSMDIPYASDWTPLSKRQHQVAGSELYSPSFRLRPLGALMTYTVRNTRAKAISLSGIKVVSNVLLPNASLDLSATKLSQVPAGGRLRWIDYGEDYTNHTYSYDFPISNLASGSTSSAALVVWYPTSGAVSRTSFGYNDGTPDSPRPNVKYPEYSKSQDPEIAARYATTHVYAVGATEAGQAITRPNLDLVPIMGTDLALKGGKSYYMDCEVYAQPHIQLGYIAKQPMVLNQSTGQFGFADPDNISNENVKLYSHTDLGDYMDLTNVWDPKMKKPLKVNGVDFNIPTPDVMVASGLFRTNAVFFENRFLAAAGKPVVYHKRAVYDERGFAPIQGGQVLPSRNACVITYSDVKNHVATSILFRHDTLAAVAGHPIRSEHQTVYRLVPTGRKPYAEDNQRDAFDYIEVRAVYLGKYFVGDVKDFIPESFWADANNTRNMVKRRYFLPGSYEYLRYTAGPNTGQYSSSRITKVGAEGVYWLLASSQWTQDSDGEWVASPAVGDVGTYAVSQKTQQALLEQWSYRVLQPYSTTYQGRSWR